MTARRAASAAAALALALVPAPGAAAGDAEHAPSVDCSLFWRYSGVLMFAGHATAPTTHQAPVALTIRCTYYTEFASVTAVNTQPGYVASTFGTAPLSAGSVRVCGSAEAWYADGHAGVTPESCWDPLFDV